MGYLDKVVLMTGGVSGLGQAVVKGFLEKGAKVCITDIKIKEGNDLLKNYQKQFGENKVIFTKCDVTKDEDFDNAFTECEKHLGVVDILINSAMYIVTDWKKSTDINYGGIVRGTETALKRIGKHNGGKGGHVVNIGSITGVSVAFFLPFYGPAKSAVIHYSRCAGHEFHYSYTGVSVQSICQSAIDTEVMDQIKGLQYSPATVALIKAKLDLFPKIKCEKVIDAVFKLVEEKKHGAALVVETEGEPFYVEPALTREFTK